MSDIDCLVIGVGVIGLAGAAQMPMLVTASC